MSQYDSDGDDDETDEWYKSVILLQIFSRKDTQNVILGWYDLTKNSTLPYEVRTYEYVDTFDFTKTEVEDTNYL